MHFLNNIDIEKIKANGCLRFSDTSRLEIIIEYWLLIMLSGSPLFIASLNLFSKVKNDQNLLVPSLLFCLALSFFYVIMYARLNSLKLRKVEGYNRSKNRKLIKKISTEIDWELKRHNQEISILHKDWSFTSLDWGKDLFIIYEKEVLFICCVTYTKNGMISPFHWFQNRRIENELLEKLILSPRLL